MGKKAFKYDKVLCRKLGKKIAFLRMELGLNQAELAFNANISTSYLSSIERGITDVTISTLKRLAIALNIDLRDLFTFF